MAPRNVAVAFERGAPTRLPSHSAAPSTSKWQKWARSQSQPIAIDLFSGCGGLGLGLEQAGFRVVLSADTDPWCLETHRHNMPGPAMDYDLSDPARIDALAGLVGDVEVDLIAGGPPCQPFSRAGLSKIRSLVEEGARPENDERRELWQAYVELIERIRPKAVLMENVPDMALGDDLIILRSIMGRLEKIGYDVEARLIDAWRHGVPQHRQRLILLARNDGRPIHWPKPVKKKTTLRDAISDLPRLKDDSGSVEAMKLGPAKTAFQKRIRAGSRNVFDHEKQDWVDGRKLIWDHVTRPVREDDREAFSIMKPGTRYGELPARLRRYRSDIFNDKYNKLAWDELSRSITAHIAKDGYWYIHPGESRTLTVRESARIQTFPDSFRFAGTRSHAWRQIGNAVPPALGEALGGAILESRSSRKLTKAQSPTTIRQKVQELLLTWGKEDANTAPWRHPGDPWQVMAGVVLGDRVGTKDEAVQSFLQEFPAVGKSISTRIRAASKKESGRLSTGYRKMADVAKSLGSSRKAWESGKAFKAAGLGESERAFVATVGLGEDHVLFTAPILRVVGCLNGIEMEGRSAGADLRMLVGQLVGGSEQSPALMASLRAIGRGICTSDGRDSRKCPLKKVCLKAKGKKG